MRIVRTDEGQAAFLYFTNSLTSMLRRRGRDTKAWKSSLTPFLFHNRTLHIRAPNGKGRKRDLGCLHLIGLS